MKIDAHVQFNGTGYQTYLTYQPGLSCETPDHQTCKIVSVHLQAIEDAKSQEQRDAEDATRKAQVDEAARLQARDLYKERIDEAGRMKWEAQRVAGVRKTVAIREAEAKATAKIQKALEQAGLARDEAQEQLKKDTDAAITKHIEETQAIEGTDWLAKVPDPDAEAKAKADAEAKAKESVSVPDAATLSPAASEHGEGKPAPTTGEAAAG